MKRAVKANNIKTTPPTKVTVRTEIRWAIMRPPKTAKPVHMLCPKIPAITTAMTFSLAAKTIVANCDLSPHSARNVMVKACRNILETKAYKRLVRAVPPVDFLA